MYRLYVFALDCFGGHLVGMLIRPIECLLLVNSILMMYRTFGDHFRAVG